MCVFNRVMVDSGTIQFIASQEMARKQGEGEGAAGNAEGPFPSGGGGWWGGGVHKQHHPRMEQGAPRAGYS